MARNELSRKKFEVKRNTPERFDATPFVDIIMDKLAEKDEDNEIGELITTAPYNPEFSFIFGKSSLLNIHQKSQVLMDLAHRLGALEGFDSAMYLEELTNLHIYGSPDFEKFRPKDENGYKAFDFDLFFEQYDLTREQKTIIMEDFYKLQSERAKIGRSKVGPTLLLSLVLIIIPPFFIPNLLQKWGVLPESAGWLLKIFIGVLSLIPLYFLIATMTGKVIDNILKREDV